MLVCKRKTMKQSGPFIGMFVLPAGKGMASCMHIPNLIVVGQSQKGNKWAHVGSRETTCPKNHFIQEVFIHDFILQRFHCASTKPIAQNVSYNYVCDSFMVQNPSG